MYSSARFSELMKGLSRSSFNQRVKKFGGNMYCKGFNSYDHLSAMVFAQLSSSTSSREVEAVFNGSGRYQNTWAQVR